MNLSYAVLYLIVILVFDNISAERTRQKRCIVIQKQSGTRSDSPEADDDDDSRRPQPKDPRPDDGRHPSEDFRRREVESFPPEFLKYRLPMKKIHHENRIRNKLYRKYLH